MRNKGAIFTVAAVLLGQVGAVQAQERATTRIDVEDNLLVISIGPVDLPLPTEGQDDHDMQMGPAVQMGDPMRGDGAAAEGGGHNGGMIMPPVQEVRVPFDAYVYGFGYDVIDGQGNDVPSQVLHHLNVIDPLRRDLFLPISYRVAAVGGETPPMQLPRFLFGNPVTAGQPLVVAAMLHNPTGEAWKDVTVRFYFKYMRTGRPWPLFSVYGFQMDVAFPAGDKDFDLPPGLSSKSWEGSPSIDGRIVAIGGHMHANAVNLVLEDVTDGKQVWEGEPILGKDGELVGVTVGRLYRRLGVRIRRDHTYRVTVTYDNPTADTIPAGGMGLIAGLFIPSIDGWPLADVNDELYELDRRHYLREVRGSIAELMRSDSTTADGRSDQDR